MSSTSTGRRLISSLSVVTIMLTGIIAVGMGSASQAAPAKAKSPGIATRAASPTLKAVVSLSPKATTVGHRVTATIDKSTLPTGDKAKTITFRWGDHTKSVKLTSLRAKPTHSYSGAGRYGVVLTITDQNKKTVHATETEVVTAVHPPVGSYTGADPNLDVVDPVTFFVSSKQTSLQDIAIPYGYMTCTPDGANINQPFTIPAVAIKPNGSFTATATQSGDYAGSPARFSYTFRGDYDGPNASGVAAFGGTFRETLTYTSSARQACTSGVQLWTATRDTQPAQKASAPPAGSYTGSDPDYDVVDPITFYVSAKQTALQDISIPYGYMTCAPGGSTINQPFTIPSATIKADGSFSGTQTQTGDYEGHPATFSYSFRGNFHSVGPSGAERAAGTFRVTLRYDGAAATTCTSDNQLWTASRDAQPAQKASPPPSGSYKGSDPDYDVVDPITFNVASNRSGLQNISIPFGYMTCSPGGANINEPFTIAATSVKADGSFSATKTQAGVYANQPATYTYTFRGNFHSVGPSGAERAAGTFRETITYNGSAATTCTSNNQLWTAARTG
jgi:hypothetical protein